MNEQSDENVEVGDTGTSGPEVEESGDLRGANRVEATNDAAPGSESVVAEPLPPADAGTSWRPADYYAAPRGPAKFPRWVPVATGVGAIVVIGLMAVVGMFLQAGGLSKLIAIAVGQVNSEAARMFDDDVEPEARESFSQALLEFRDAIADGKIELSAALPVMQQMQKATRDGRLSAVEVDELTSAFETSRATPPASTGDEPPVVDL